LGAGARRRFLEKFDMRMYGNRLSQLHAALLLDIRDCGTIRNEQISL
jgi:hypothetical protein